MTNYTIEIKAKPTVGLGPTGALPSGLWGRGFKSSFVKEILRNNQHYHWN